MIKRLTRHGNSYALIIDRAILELLNIAPDAQLEISTDGQALLIERLDAAPDSAHGKRRRAKPTLRDLRRHRDAILELAARHGARNVRVFGSVVRGKARPNSDVDLLVDMEPERSLIDRTALMQEIEDLLGYKVDVVNERSLNRLIRDRVLQEGVAL
jgi:predicted nucleotidyltransferase